MKEEIQKDYKGKRLYLQILVIAVGLFLFTDLLMRNEESLFYYIGSIPFLLSEHFINDSLGLALLSSLSAMLLLYVLPLLLVFMLFGLKFPGSRIGRNVWKEEDFEEDY